MDEEPIRIPVTDILDLHSIPPRDVKAAVEEYLEEAGMRPVHISEICTALGVPRRSLHRAFNEVFGMGPVTFLRHKRLCAIHSILRESIPGTTTVATVAMQQGFYELGRFSQYYRAMFGEYPSQTLGLPLRELA